MDELLLVIRVFPIAWVGDFLAISLLGAYYIFATDASSSSKTIVVALLAASVVALFVKPNYWLWVLLSQVAVGIYIVFYRVWKGE